MSPQTDPHPSARSIHHSRVTGELVFEARRSVMVWVRGRTEGRLLDRARWWSPRLSSLAARVRAKFANVPNPVEGHSITQAFVRLLPTSRAAEDASMIHGLQRSDCLAQGRSERGELKKKLLSRLQGAKAPSALLPQRSPFCELLLHQATALTYNSEILRTDPDSSSSSMAYHTRLKYRNFADLRL